MLFPHFVVAFLYEHAPSPATALVMLPSRLAILDTRWGKSIPRSRGDPGRLVPTVPSGKSTGASWFFWAKNDGIRRLSQLPEGSRQSQPPYGYRGAMPHANPGSRGAAREICFFRYPYPPLLADFGSLSTTVMNQ